MTTKIEILNIKYKGHNFGFSLETSRDDDFAKAALINSFTESIRIKLREIEGLE